MRYMISLAFSVLVGCGGGGDSSAPLPLGNSGFPEVSGRYSFNTGQVRMVCTDGSRATNPALALNFDVDQNANEITLSSTVSVGATPGLTVTNSSVAAGNVRPNSSFIVNQFAVARIDNVSGEVNISYNISGSFNQGGWSGSYSYNISSSSSGACDFTTAFSGTKISSAKVFIATPSLTEYKSVYANQYDSYGDVGSLIGQ